MYWVLTSEMYPTVIRGTDARSGISLVTSDKPIAPIELNDKIPLSLSILVMECCREDPNERPADMKQMGARLAVVQKLWRKYREKVRAGRHVAEQASGGGAQTVASDPPPVSGGSNSTQEIQVNNDTVRSVEEGE